MFEKKILIADDVELNREILEEILEKDYQTLSAADGTEVIRLLEEQKDDIGTILLDLVMPVSDGFEVLEYMNKRGLTETIPVLVISSEEAIKTEKRCFELGVSDFIRKPFDNTLVLKRVNNITELYSYKRSLEEKVRTQTEQLRAQHQQLKAQAETLKRNNQNITEILGTVVEYRDVESGDHIKRVKDYSRVLATQMMEDYPEYGLDKDTVEMIVEASALHDIGKIAIPDSILLKPSRLTRDEYEYMKSHTVRGCEILEHIDDAWNEEYAKYLLEICRSHHERFDGRGYPDGLRGDEIPISAQVVSVADVYDALVNERCYKDAYSLEQSYHMIMQGECGVFSPKLLEAFRKSRGAFEKISTRSANKA